MELEDVLREVKESNEELRGQLQILSEKFESIEDCRNGDDEILDVKGVMALTGMAKQTIYQLKNGGKIPSFKFGTKLLRFHKNEILEWMLSRNKDVN